MTIRNHHLAAALACCLGPFLLLSGANAGDRPLIWEFSKQSDTSYSARLGSSLPRVPEASIGADIRMRGPNPAVFHDPVSLWADLQLAERSKPRAKRSAHLNARIDGRSGRRSVSLDNSVTRRLQRLDAELSQRVTVFQEPAGNHKARLRASQSVRLSSPATRTTVTARASRSDSESWQTSIAVEKYLRESIRLSASVENPGTSSRAGRLGARYRYDW